MYINIIYNEIVRTFNIKNKTTKIDLLNNVEISSTVNIQEHKIKEKIVKHSKNK